MLFTMSLHKLDRERFRAFCETNFFKVVPSPGPFIAPVFGKYKFSRNYFVDFIFDYHSNSVFKTWKQAEEITFKTCYECGKCVSVSRWNPKRLDTIDNKYHLVCNSVIYERCQLPKHYIVLCNKCVGKCS